ncbi:MAG: Smr/MutS family protein [Acidobacteriota bacterium]
MHCENVLEFEQLRALLGRYLRSPIGRAELNALEPVSDREAIGDALADAAEALEYLRSASNPQTSGRGGAARLRFDFDGDPNLLRAHLRIEGVTLDGVEIFQLTRLLDLASEARSAIMGSAARYPRLAAHAAQIADLRELTNDLRGKILPDGSLADSASVALARLRKDAERQRKSIEHSLERFLRAHHEDGTLQEDFVTVRNDRFVVPIVTGRERRVDGVIHGSSGSGQTVFVEPLETVQMNNELVRLREEELREIHRILREFSARLRQQAPAIGMAIAAMGKLELLFVKAEFAIDFRCSIPALGDRVLLRAARHPLLEDILRKSRGNVVPMSLELTAVQKTLLISGPNTGGKTVALKTIGLLALMTHAGLPVPAEEAEFPLFDQVLADIGDHQSLAESLSSFSSHIVTVKSMLERATGDSLVLMDELGRATDPEEGGALGVTILEEFRHRGSYTAASTHLMAMKVYGASTNGVLNASMGFDDATLAPTYVLRLGAPGKSAGLDIASRLGLEPWLIADARSRLSNTERDVADFLAKLNQQLETLSKERSEVELKKAVLDAREASMEQSWERKYADKIRTVDAEAAKLAQEFEQRAQDTIEDLSQKAKAKIAKTRREYREQVEALAPTPVARAAASTAVPALKLQEGTRVRLKGIRQPATVRRLLNDGGIEVEAGFLKIQVPESDIEEILTGKAALEKPTGIRLREGPSFDGNFREINLIGRRAEEACEALDKFLDTVSLAQVDRVRIVHGHGMGILKRAVGELLKTNPHVARYYVAPPEEGGSGSTIVELK